jgi:hypothetical protein
LRHRRKKEKHENKNERNHASATRQSVAVSFTLQHYPPFFHSIGVWDVSLDDVVMLDLFSLAVT